MLEEFGETAHIDIHWSKKQHLCDGLVFIAVNTYDTTRDSYSENGAL